MESLLQSTSDKRYCREMADVVPVCDVLCEAMEYLSKLGSNLRDRSDNLRDKKIRKDRLKNTHAVQKAAKKVLLICELSKRSLDNIETGIKSILTQIDLSQTSTSSGGKSSRTSIESASYHYFEYTSERLKIKEKICLEHYTSVKVVVKSMPVSIFNKYPVYHDCKLYRLQKVNAEKAMDEDHHIENNVDTNCNIQDNNILIEKSKPDDVENNSEKLLCDDNDKDHQKINNQNLTTDPINLLSTEKEKSLGNRDNNINSDQSCDNSVCENNDKDKVIHQNTAPNASQPISKEDEKKEEEDNASSIHPNSPQSLSKDEEPSKCSNNVDRDDTSSESADGKKSFIKCVNINKLLAVPSKEDDNLKKNKDPITTTKLAHKQVPATSKKKGRKKFKKILKPNTSSDESSHDSDFGEKRKAVKLFKPKDFEIKITRLPKLSVNYLKANGLKKIIQNGLTVCEIQSDLNEPKKKQSTEKCSDLNEPKRKQSTEKCSDLNEPKRKQSTEKCSEDVSQCLSEIIEEEKQETDKLNEKTSENDILKESQINNSDSDIDLLNVAESVRNALLHASDSDRQSEFECPSSSATTATPAPDGKETANEKGDNSIPVESIESMQTLINEDADKNTQASLINSPSEDNPNSAMKAKSPTKDAEVDIPLSLHSSQDPDKIKLLLLNDSSDSSVSNSRNKTKMNEDDNKKIDEDPEKVKSLLLHDSSDNKSEEPLLSSQENGKRRRRIKKHVMESMYAKKMLLTHSSSSDTDDESVRQALKEVKKSWLEVMMADKGKQCIKIRPHSHSDSDSVLAEATKKKCCKRKAKSRSENSDLKLRLGIKKKRSSKTNNSDSEDNEDSNSSANKMGRSRAKRGSSSRQNSDSQDANDKDIDGLTNLSSLNKLRRRRDSSTHRTAESCDSNPSVDKMPKAPRIKAEELLKAETSSDGASLVGSDEGEEAEELPTVSMAALNGDGISHLAKDALLDESDSSTSQNDNTQEESKKSESEEETVKSKRRVKTAAISSDSEAGSSKKPGRGRRLSDFEDSDDDGSSEPAGKKRRKKKDSDSDGDGSDSGKKRRRRIKNVDDSDGSDSDTENEGRNKHGRKNIRKVMGKNQLEEATKKAAREEKERIARIAERQKVYNNLQFDESGKPDEVILEKVVLDFDPETKEPLIEVDRGLVRKLKPHQANGIKFMWDACFESVKRIKKDKGSGCILAHCMGLGKTLQVVSLTHTLLTHGNLTSVKRVLVVCPLSTVLNWVNEFRIWLKHAERDYEVDVYEISRFKQNSERAFQLQQWFVHGGVCVLGYEMFRNLSADNTKKFKKKMLKNFQESLVDPGPDLVVCDEGHLLKNEKTSLSQSMNRVKTLRRIVLTGTPLQNNLKEYYCMVQFVKPNLLGKYNEYLNRFVNPITNGQYTDSTEHDIKIMKRRSHVLHKMLDGAVQRRDYGVLAPFLPPKHEYVLFITLTEVQIKLYQHYLDNYSRRPLPGKSSGFLFPDFQSLQRIWTHPLVLKYNSERYEIMQQKKREREEEDSEGSLVDFIDDDSTPDESSTEESSDDCSDGSDDSRKKSKKKKSAKKGKAKDSKVTPRRGTRANPVELLEEEEKPLESLECKYENPTEWWIKLINEEELDDLRNSHKLVLLFDILRQCETIGDKLLVFSQSLYSLDLIEHFLGKVDEATQEARIDEKLGGHVGSWSPGIDYFRLDGSTSCENRSIWCKNFNREDNPRARLFLISTRAGGLGINLVAANRVVIFDVSWNPSHDVQSIFRVYRFGQKKPCYVYRFLAMGTMEEKIYERQVTKQAISKRVIDEQQIDRHYAENDLAELYKFEPRPPSPRPLPPLPKDRLFAELLREHDAQIYKYHEHDSLLENKEEETLSEEERKAAWEDFENEKNRPPPAPLNAWPGVPGLLQQQQLAYATLGAMLRKDMPNMNNAQIHELLYNTPLMQKMSEMYKYPQPGMMNNAAMNSFMNAGGGGVGNMGGTSGLQYEPPWLRQQRQQQQMMQQQQQQQNLGAKFYAGGLGSRDPVAMAIQQQRTREMMLGERAGAGARPRGRPPLPRNPPPSDVVDLADSD